MPLLINRPRYRLGAVGNTPSERQEITNRMLPADVLALAEGILRQSADISPGDEDTLFKALGQCTTDGWGGVGPPPDGLRSREGIDALRKGVIDRLVKRNMPLVHKMRRRCAVFGVDQDDMLSEGSWSLYRAVEGFDVHRGLRFSTYASRSILYSFLTLAKKRRREREVLEKFVKERPMVTHPSDPEIGVDGPLLLDRVKAAMFDKSASFSKMECFVIEQRFLAASPKRPRSLGSIGRDFKLTKERVRQIQHGALAKLRVALSDRSELLLPIPIAAGGVLGQKARPGGVQRGYRLATDWQNTAQARK